MLLALENVWKAFPSPAGGPVLDVLQGVELHVEAGDFVSIVGPSGSGKSTLLNLIGALDHPTAGRVLLDGHDLAGLSDALLARARQRDIGFLFQLHHLLPQLSVLENVLLPTLADGGPSTPEQVERARELCGRVGLGERLRHRPGQLSGGERQRVALARALIHGPRLLLADEPTGSVDHHTATALADLLMEVNRDQHVALVVVTHWAGLARRAPRQLALRDGRLVDADASGGGAA